MAEVGPTAGDLAGGGLVVIEVLAAVARGLGASAVADTAVPFLLAAAAVVTDEVLLAAGTLVVLPTAEAGAALTGAIAGTGLGMSGVNARASAAFTAAGAASAAVLLPLPAAAPCAAASVAGPTAAAAARFASLITKRGAETANPPVSAWAGPIATRACPPLLVRDTIPRAIALAIACPGLFGESALARAVASAISPVAIAVAVALESHSAQPVAEAASEFASPWNPPRP